jgi:hypothetical protein
MSLGRVSREPDEVFRKKQKNKKRREPDEVLQKFCYVLAMKIT